ncbi:ABC transporter ATP-binding protein [Virgibacillus soli]|uniref:ABC transporter ATP-binding protein n=1 Tax=Paracerasibacillus soli TaxID=480284 RepID=UPI0035EAF992
MKNKPFVYVENLSLRFDHTNEIETLSNISFAMQEGESLLLLGPSGSGKSTLTFCLNGLYPRELDGEMTGDIVIAGKRTNDYQPGELSQFVGVVFQDPETQFCMLTVEDEIAFGLENMCTPYEKMSAKIDEVLALVGLSKYKTATIARLSGGQKQKLALACILALEPKLLILDEPTANLDPVSAKEVMKTIKKLKEKVNCSLIIIEHQLDGWTDVAERCILLNQKGNIFFDGSLRDAIAHEYPKLIEEGIWLPKVAQYVLHHMEHVPATVPLTLAEFATQVNCFGKIEWKKPTSMQQNVTVPFIKLENVSWTVNRQRILSRISFTLYKDEFVAIVGANGSGKTSLSRIIAGIQKPTDGNIYIKEKALKVWQEGDLRKELGYVFQNPEHQFIANTVFDEVAFTLRTKGMKADEVKEKVRHVLAVCGISHLENEHPYTLSQGQKRRLSVATMVVDNQTMLLLDEPTFGQDASSNKKLMELLVNRYEAGTAITMITHDMELVHQYATRVIVMHKGEIVADCTPIELWNYPKTQLDVWQLTIPVPEKMQRIWERNVAYVSSPS